MNDLVTPETLLRYFENKATRHEKQLIEEWLKVKENEELFYQQLALWESTHMQFSPDVDRARKAYAQFLDGGQEPALQNRLQLTQRKNRFWTFGRVTAIAASTALLLACSLLYYQHYFLFATYATGYGMTRNLILEDGSEVTLNANSKLKVPRDMKGDRHVWLQGEAFFSVTKKIDKVRFFVHTENVNVEVLGTKFNVNSRHEKTTVVLNEGSVKLTSNLPSINKPLMMTPGEMASLAKEDLAFTKKNVKPEQYNAWQNNVLVFSDASLSTVARSIEDYYGVEVVIDNPELANRQLTGTMPNNDLGIVLKSLSASLKISIERVENKIIFK
jgi:ferric-dicitrate binding protein FerR (iron transport regulator)